MSDRSFVIDSLPQSAASYRQSHAIVAVDVFRATTLIVTALACGHPIYPVATVVEALDTAARLHDPLLAGELAGVKPQGFDLNNSPAAVERLGDCRAIVHLSSAGTQLLIQARGASSIYVACLRNLTATARQLAASHLRIALIGAGTNGSPRPEDQYACARIGETLLAAGYSPEDQRTEGELARWKGLAVEELRESPSADFLRNSEQTEDLEYVLSRVDDVDAAAVFNGQQVSLLLPIPQSLFAAEA